MTEPKPIYTVTVKPAPEEPEAPPALIDLPDAARRLGISLTTLRRLIAAGELPIVTIGRAYRVDPRDLDAFIDAHKRQ